MEVHIPWKMGQHIQRGISYGDKSLWKYLRLVNLRQKWVS